MKKIFNKMCEEFKLGNLEKSPIIINGGITNKVYKIVTSEGIYAIKIINKNKINEDKTYLQRIENSEKIADIASENGINTIGAIKVNNKFVQIVEDNYILIYNWCDGEILLTKQITSDNLEAVANSLAKLHIIETKNNMNYKTIKYKKIDYKKYYTILKDNKEEWAEFFCKNYDKLNDIYNKVYLSYKNLNDNKSYVHRDLNRKNIIWRNNIPYIIDWETSTIDNPTIDFFNTAWFMSADVNEEKYYTFIKEYLSINKLEEDINNAVYAGIIYECNWLEFSLKRALEIHSNDITEINLGKESIKPSIIEIINYYNKIPLMINIFEKVKNENKEYE